MIYLPIFFRVALLSLGWSYECRGASEIILTNMGEIGHYVSTTKHYKAWTCGQRPWFLDCILPATPVIVNCGECRMIAMRKIRKGWHSILAINLRCRPIFLSLCIWKYRCAHENRNEFIFTWNWYRKWLIPYSTYLHNKYISTTDTWSIITHPPTPTTPHICQWSNTIEYEWINRRIQKDLLS